MADGVNNFTRRNLIYGNGVGLASGSGMDIDLGDDGASANDLDDADDGPNHKQKFPLIDQLYVTGNAMTATAHLNAAPGTYQIDAYVSMRCDNGSALVAGRGHAEKVAGYTSVEIPPAGNDANFSISIGAPAGYDAGFVSLLATDSMGNTSKIGSCFSLSSVLIDTVFADGFEPNGPDDFRLQPGD